MDIECFDKICEEFCFNNINQIPPSMCDTCDGECYEKFIEGNMDKIKLAILCNNGDAIFALGYYYFMKNKNYRKYYKIAVKLGNPVAMYALAEDYWVDHNYDQMEKYLTLAINKGNIDAMRFYADHINNKIGKPHDSIKYYVMAINGGDLTSIYPLSKIISLNDIYSMIIDKESATKYVIEHNIK